MFRKSLALLVAVSIALLSSSSFASEDSELILKILIKKGVITQQEVDEMRAEIAAEKAKTTAQAEAPKTLEERIAGIEKDLLSKVGLDKIASRLKLKGRAATGFFYSGERGSYPKGSFEIPEAKIQLAFQPDDINTFVMRFNLNNGATNISSTNPLLDYLYLQSKDFLPFLKKTPFSLSGRLGRFKLGFGEETWSNNLVEGIVPSNSAGNVGMTDEGLELSGKIKLDKIGLTLLGWVASISNGNADVGLDNSSYKALMAKIYYSPIDPLYLAATYYNSGKLKTASSAMSIAGLITPPTGAIDWSRSVWEVDARCDVGKGKKPLEPVAYSDSKVVLRTSYGQFNDEASGLRATGGRGGQFGFVDGAWNLTKKIFVSGRFSFVYLDDDATASLNGITANKYNRYSLAAGYRWFENTIIRFGYDWNDESGPHVSDVDNDLLSAYIAAQF